MFEQHVLQVYIYSAISFLNNHSATSFRLQMFGTIMVTTWLVASSDYWSGDQNYKTTCAVSKAFDMNFMIDYCFHHPSKTSSAGSK